MRAVICHGPRDYRLEEIPVPACGPGEALVRVEAVGICASDLKCYHGAPKFWGDANRPAWAQTGVVPGHEFVGEIVRLDDAAARRWGVAVGDRVVSEQIVPCWQCRYCRRGQYHMCRRNAIYGFQRHTPGAMAQYMIYPAEALVHKVSADLPPAHAAFTEPLSCALHAVERAGITFDDVVVVAGCGPIGLGMVAGARAKHPARVIALDPIPEKLALARACGADLTIDPREQDARAIIADLTDGYGADVYLEATGHPIAVPQGLELLRKQGTYVEYGVFGAAAAVDWSIIGDDKELDIRGAHLGPHCWPAAIRMLESGVLPMDRICSHQLPLDDFQQGLDLVSSGTESVKVSLLPS
ncbi:threonine dehydrogenase-like Zn-dependent dehydrogenase [Nocardia pseudobrasiliensis]|uniref:Threonine dehydrogenase-like Zn-dependent dehydrogenase n=2 Tax=Nocardia pseudobrasiliensis TaxID=45979 RepID=A0A370IBA8_9NOCA|nr:threonine dehydrogenase-like Zn-dependent dehydrogenase [Nocardia pseudobrasiliensis]